MFKKKCFLIIIAAFLFVFYFQNISIAADNNNAGLTTRYPDYSCLFTGKDTCENYNRKVFSFDLQVNKYIIRPLTIAWSSVMPQYGIDRIQNFYTNITFPVRLTSCLLQRDFHTAKTESLRFLTNTTIGFVGLYDPAQTKYKIEPRKEDIGQALASYNVKSGPYIVLPIITRGSVRDIAGQALALPLDPTSYIIGPISAISTGLSYLNDTTTWQPITQNAYDYADPYVIAKEFYGVDRYIKISNIDRDDFLKETNSPEKNVKINNLNDNVLNNNQNDKLNADIKLNNYKPQSSTVTAMRTILFDNQNLNNSPWSELSVWNKSFNKRIKTSSVNMGYNRPNYKYRYILQKDKNSPLAIIYPSIGESIRSSESTVQAKILYDEGYSVAILGSAFQWEFIKSMPDDYRPGLPYQDAHYLRLVTAKILLDLELKKGCTFDKKIIVGSSFGGLTSLFVAAAEEHKNTLGISKYITICPPIDLFYALQQIDKYSLISKNSPEELKKVMATADEKVEQLTKNVSEKNDKKDIEALPVTEDEAELLISFVMRQKLSDVIYTIEHGSRLNTSAKDALYEQINNMSFYDYAQKYLISTQNKSVAQLDYESSLLALTDFLQKSKNYKIYHSLDDCFTNPQQLVWLKKQTNNKSVYFSSGSHLGFMYRNEFINEFKKDIKLTTDKAPNKI